MGISFIKIHSIVISLFLLLLLLFPTGIHAASASFPGAQGFGATSMGGRQGRVIEVLNLNDSGAGSLRTCIESTGPRVCIFKVSGEIVLQTPLRLIGTDKSYLTVAGQTAQGGGITLRLSGIFTGGPTLLFGGNVHDVIIQYLKVRPGLVTGVHDGITITSGNNILFDHVSFQWASDENLSMQTTANDGFTIYNVTVQNSILAETLSPHSKSVLINADLDWNEPPVEKISFHHNIFANSFTRNPQISQVKNFEFIHNTVYNWGQPAGLSILNSQADFVGNVLKRGPWNHPTSNVWWIQAWYENGNDRYTLSKEATLSPSLYINGNKSFPDTPTDQWGYFVKRIYYVGSSEDSPIPDSYKRNARFTPGAEIPVVLENSTEDAMRTVLTSAGDNKSLQCDGSWFRKPDVIDQKIILDIQTGTGPNSEEQTDSHDDYGGYPTISGGVPCTDSDTDGMPDSYETKFNLQLQSNDSNTDADADGYTNIEEYLQGADPNSPVISTPVPFKQGDANDDTKVDGIDYVLWLKNYNANFLSHAKGDFNYSGKVDGIDYVVWLKNYGT